MAQMTNTQFAAETGYHHTSVSRLRNGHRLPSTQQLVHICDTYGLDLAKFTRAHAEGADVFSALLREAVLGEEEPLWQGELPEEAAGFEG
jgi:transcriptional regulator with XRE-family HTH domain